MHDEYASDHLGGDEGIGGGDPTGPTRPTGETDALPAGAADRRDALIGRIVDGEASAGDWDRFQAHAADHPGAWRMLAEQQHDARAMGAAFASIERIAERTSLPEAPARTGEPAPMISLSGFVRGAGWAVAAGVALAWSFAALRAPAGRDGVLQPSIDQGAGIQNTGLSVHDPDEALKAYLQLGQQSGRVLGEMPQRVLLQSTQLEPGRGYEVIYVRPFVERGVVEDLLRFSSDTQDEFGRPVVTPVTWPNRQSWDG